MRNYIQFSIISFIISAVFIGIGIYKLFFYKNSDVYEQSINAHVGGDAYNYIINANQATSFFVLALIFVVLGSALLIIYKLLQMHHSNINAKKDEEDLELLDK